MIRLRLSRVVVSGRVVGGREWTWVGDDTSVVFGASGRVVGSRGRLWVGNDTGCVCCERTGRGREWTWLGDDVFGASRQVVVVVVGDNTSDSHLLRADGLWVGDNASVSRLL